MMTNDSSQHGFTLIELILYVAISSMLLITISVFLSLVLQSRIKHQTIAEVEQQGTQAMYSIQQALRNAESIVTPAVGASGTSLQLTTPSALTSPTIFNLAGGALRIQEGSGSAIPLTNTRVTVSGLTFRNLSRATTPGSVQIQFTVTYTNTTGRNEYNYAKTFTSGASLRHP